MRTIRSIAGAMCVAMSLALPDAFAQSNDALRKIVIVNRHGVRTPTIASEELATWAAQPWPAWKEPRGDLTERGGLLATLLGRYDREYLAAQGLLPTQGCPTPGSVTIDADVIQRTRATAQGLADGIAPGCAIPVLTKAPAKVDGVFHPVDAGVCRIDALTAQESVLARVGGDFTHIADQNREAFNTLQAALGCCKPALCTALSRPEGCTLPELPTALVSYADGKGVGFTGALSIASVASEIFLLEYTDGKNAADVGWGRVSLPQIQQTLALHDMQFDLTERTPYLARRYGSSLLARVAGALTGQAFGGLAAPEAAVRDAKLVAYVGHDTNIANLGGMLGMTWTMPGYQPNETPPAGALVFELREDGAKRQRIYTYFLAQTPDQMRDATPLTLAAPPIKTPIRIPGCSNAEAGYPCGVDDFAQVIRAAIDADCIQKP